MEHEQISFVGAWKLISFEFRRDEGETMYPFGEKAQGSIIYTESGRYSAQLMRVDRPRFAVPDQMRGTSQEIEASYRGCISYFGSYEVDHEMVLSFTASRRHSSQIWRVATRYACSNLQEIVCNCELHPLNWMVNKPLVFCNGKELANYGRAGTC